MLLLLPQQHQRRHQMLPLMPRAAARVLGQWVSDLKNEDRQAAYTALTVLLVQPQQQAQGQEPDLVLQLAAVAALRLLVDDFGFEGQAFVGVLPTVVNALTGILKNSDELDTQTQVRFLERSDARPRFTPDRITVSLTMKTTTVILSLIRWQSSVYKALSRLVLTHILTLPLDVHVSGRLGCGISRQSCD